MKDNRPNNNPPDNYEQVGQFTFIFQRKGSKNWYVYLRHNSKPLRRSLKTTKKKQAKSLALAMERDLLAGKLATQEEVPLIKDAVKEYMAHLVGRRRTSKTLSKYSHCFDLVKQIAIMLGVKRLDQVDFRFIDAFRNERAKTSAPKTVLNDLVTIRQLVNFALKRKQLYEDPLAGISFDKPRQEAQPYWSREETKRIIASASPQYRPLFHFLAETGTRVGEAVWLRWEDIDFRNSVIRIQPKEGWTPKTGDERSIPISPQLLPTLQDLGRAGEWVFTARPTHRHPEKGRQISDRRALAHLKRVLKSLSLPGHLHTFRHSFISHALTSGVPDSIVRRWVGHVDQKIMERYTHIADKISQREMGELFPKEEDETDQAGTSPAE